ncbi:hypothetical protein [Mesorhizobium sp. M2A.F.Ca.ET.067.02.1.1]|uniref:hypothetical protein n=1 Tax=Mesorhizobium sp. M2A.F.Ca.ET.067.02.1.1 TaxID=2496749 RepID=UPI000FD4D0D2|nr:hypothetical protein [Mesorhizobium sp. M2A.F.Ca.ET.067.02.1.1]RUW81547.1 hypothetical protein EOA28_01070 [Mesorhizobium sp. M2A.F.Ca.ET.067.02.1.1]TIU58124.1 MAG: hypothetical protein E5W35_05885 [Mesorhizobium sp.]
MFRPLPEDEEERRRRLPTISQALDMWEAWHSDCSPLGCTGNYTLDMRLADAFRDLLYRPELCDRLDWIERQLREPRHRAAGDRYHAELIKWWLELFAAGSLPTINQRLEARELRCASS